MSTGFRVDKNIYMMVMTKKEDLLEYSKHDASTDCEYTTFGYFDFVRFQKINSMEEMLKVPGYFEDNKSKGDALVHNFSLFTVGDDVPFLETDGQGSFEKNFLKQNITMVSMIKLDPRVMANKHKDMAGCQSDCHSKVTGLDVLVEAQEANGRVDKQGKTKESEPLGFRFFGIRGKNRKPTVKYIESPCHFPAILTIFFKLSEIAQSNQPNTMYYTK